MRYRNPSMIHIVASATTPHNVLVRVGVMRIIRGIVIPLLQDKNSTCRKQRCNIWFVDMTMVPRSTPFGYLADCFDVTGFPTRAGIVLTKSLLFIAEGTGAAGASPIFRAVDKQTGDILAEIDLPANQTGLRATRLSNRRFLKQSLFIIYKKPDSKSGFLYMAKRGMLRFVSIFPV